MSTASIIVRLEDELAAFQRKEKSSDEFSVTVYACVEAMDGVCQKKRDEIRRIQYALDRLCLEEKEGRFSDRSSIVSDVTVWLAEMKTEPNQRPEGTPGKSSPSKPSQVPGAPHP